MHRTPLHQFHVQHGAKMVEFAGWEMPMLYKRPDGTGSIHEEHRQVRSSGGIFDVSHMGRLKINGRHARRFLERVCSRRIADMEPGQCRYTLVCNERGGVHDDALVYRFDDDDFLVVVNASNREKIIRHFEAIKGDMIFKMEDRTFSTAMVAMQGPKVMDLISKFSREIPTLKRYRFTEKNLMIMKVVVSRTGYTGEDGIEAILPGKLSDTVIKMILKDVDVSDPQSPLHPAGLGARDTLRLEAGMPLYGHELGEEIDALSSGLDFAINLDKGEGDRGEPFIGMEALLRIRDGGGPKRTLVGLLIDGKRTARQGMLVRSGGAEVGEVTSACISPTLDRPIAMAYLDRAHAETGARAQIDAGSGVLEAEVTKLPFYKAPKKS